MRLISEMKLATISILAALVALAGCGAQSSPPSYPANAAPATAVIVDTDLAGSRLSVQDGDQVIAMMHGRHFARVSIRPGSHNFSAGAGRLGEGGGTVPVDVQPGQTIYLQVGGVTSRLSGVGGASPGLPSRVGRAEGAFGQGAISLIPQSSADYLIKQYTEQPPLPPS